MSSWNYDPRAYENLDAEPQYVAQPTVDIGQMLMYQLKGKPAFGYVDLNLQPNQKVIADANSMLWMDAHVEEPTTEIFGSLLHGCARECAGEHCCLNTFQARERPGKVAVGFDMPGDILSFCCTPGNGWVLTLGAFVAGTDTIDVTARFSGFCACCFSDEGPFLTRVKCTDGQEAGVFIAGGYGALYRHDIPPGKVLFVSRGLFFAAHESVRFQMGLAGGLKNLCCTGGGAIVMKFYGPAVVYTQSRNPKDWNPYKDTPKDVSGGGSA